MSTNEKSPATNEVLEACDRCGHDYYRPLEPLIEAQPRGESVSLCEECKRKRYCTTCGSEIIWEINESRFDEGQCGPCEYARYQTQPALREALDYLLEQTVDMDLAHGIELTEGEKEARERALAAIAKANGNAA